MSIIDKNSVLVFPSNSQTKLRTIKNGVQTPEQLAIDRSACKYLTDGSGHVSQLLDTSGLTFTPALAAGSGSRVLFFKPPLWTLVNSITYPGSVHFLTTSSDGTMYIPLGRGEGKSPPAVQVVGTTSYTITNGIVDPVGAAAGI